MVASVMYVHNHNTTNMSWKDRVKSRIKDMKSRFVRSRYYKPVVFTGKLLGMATTIAAYYMSVYAVAYFTIVLLLAWGANPIVAIILAIWLTVVVAFALAVPMVKLVQIIELM